LFISKHVIMKMKRLVLIFTALLLMNAAFAQSKQITGTITDSTGLPLSGVTILTDKKSRSAVSGADGTYTLAIDNSTTVLIVSSVGYATRTFPIEGRTSIDIVLYPSTAALDDVVVVGYGTQRKSHVTGAISKYTNDRLDELPVTRLDQALQGKIAGVTVQNLTSEAGGTPRVRVRGLNSINANADPLVVVDGHPVPDGLAFVNMADVASVEVLKDAASSAIYGSRGANGVILITTRSGKTDKVRYTVKMSAGPRTAYQTQDMMSVTEYVNLLYDEAALRMNDPSVPANRKNLITNNERAQYIIEDSIMGGVPFDWQKEGIRNSASVQNVQMNISGGKRDAKYFFSTAYQKEEGLMYHSNYERFSLRGKYENQLGKRVRLNVNLNPSFTARERPANNYIDFIRFPSYMPAKHTEATAAFVNQVPQWSNIRPGDWVQPGHFNGRVYGGTMPDGSIWSTSSAVDPFASSNNNPKSIMETRSINTNEYRMMSAGDITVNLASGLDFKTTISAYVTYLDGFDFAQTGNNRAGDVNRGIYTNRLFIDLLNENTLNYTHKIGDHDFSALAGFTAQKTQIKNSRIEGIDFPTEDVRTISSATQIVAPGTYTVEDNIGLLSYLARATYGFKNKYLFSASFRRDGSSYFAPTRKWGNFPSASAGWVISKENFMSNVNFVNNWKLRASFGATGNNRILAFQWLDLLYPSNFAFGSGTGTVAAGQVPSQDILANPLITWERTYQFNLGTDIALFNNAISLTVEAYQSESDRLLLRQNAMGITGANETWNNIGKVQNRGFEIELTSNNFRRKNFTWTTSLNFAHNRNKLLDFGGADFQLSTGEGAEVYSTHVGYESIRYWGYKTDGVWLSQVEADAAKAKEAAQWGNNGTSISNYFTAGGLKFQDINGDGKIDANDRTDIGSPFPAFSWGINNSLTYKAFDLTFLLQGVQGLQIINGDARYNESRRYNRQYNNGQRWISEMYPGDGQTPYFNNGANQWTISDYTVEDGSYVALREIVLGYKLPQKVASFAKLSSLRLYASVHNAYVHWANNYRGINPEARMTSGTYSSPLIDGYQRGSFPMARTVLIGIDINF
jgi:TonB-dependent starch-binding outer membrane protein SusC